MLIIKEIDVVYASKNPSLCILEKHLLVVAFFSFLSSFYVLLFLKISQYNS